VNVLDSQMLINLSLPKGVTTTTACRAAPMSIGVSAADECVVAIIAVERVVALAADQLVIVRSACAGLSFWAHMISV
jgi:hypothetical protein